MDDPAAPGGAGEVDASRREEMPEWGTGVPGASAPGMGVQVKVGAAPPPVEAMAVLEAELRSGIHAVEIRMREEMQDLEKRLMREIDQTLGAALERVERLVGTVEERRALAPTKPALRN